MEVEEPALAQTLEPDAGVEAFRVGVVEGPARSAEVERHGVGINTQIKLLRGELAALIHIDGMRRTEPAARLLKHIDHLHHRPTPHTRITGLTRLQVPMTVRTQSRRPSNNSSCIQSMAHTWFGPVAALKVLPPERNRAVPGQLGGLPIVSFDALLVHESMLGFVTENVRGFTGLL